MSESSEHDESVRSDLERGMWALEHAREVRYLRLQSTEILVERGLRPHEQLAFSPRNDILGAAQRLLTEILSGPAHEPATTWREKRREKKEQPHDPNHYLGVAITGLLVAPGPTRNEMPLFDTEPVAFQDTFREGSAYLVFAGRVTAGRGPGTWWADADRALERLLIRAAREEGLGPRLDELDLLLP